jgi:hypothetical protein
VDDPFISPASHQVNFIVGNWRVGFEI